METKTFKSFLESEKTELSQEEIEDMFKTVEDLGIIDRSWTQEEVKSALESLDWMEDISYEFIFDEINWDKKSSSLDGTDIVFFPRCSGVINSRIDSQSLKSDLVKTLEALPRSLQSGDHTIKEILSAFDDVRWQTQIDYAIDNVQLNLSHFVQWKFEITEVDTIPPRIKILTKVNLSEDDSPLRLQDLDPVKKVMENL
jgi:hypothetical protein